MACREMRMAQSSGILVSHCMLRDREPSSASFVSTVCYGLCYKEAIYPNCVFTPDQANCSVVSQKALGESFLAFSLDAKQ